MILDLFHPAVIRWFTKQFASPTEPQSKAWPSIKNRHHTLVAAPTGSGKTLAAFLSAIDDLVHQGVQGTLEDKTQVVYVSPLKALSNDIQRNLQTPLEGIQQELKAMGVPEFAIRTLVRTGDTPASERAAMVRRPPHIVVTTPESLYILLTSERGRRMLSTTRTLIVDEIHAVVGDKRGSHLALSIERLEALVGHELVRIGLSATQRPIEEVARFLIGSANLDVDGRPQCTIIDAGHIRNLDLSIEVPKSPLEAVMAGEVWDEVYDRLAELILQHRTTLVFVNTRRMAERAARHLSERIGEKNVTSHHGSLARAQRLTAEQRLKAGDLRALVATASLELGIDIGAVELVCQIGSTHSIATLLQRVGRSNHAVGGFPKGRIFPTTRDELIECTALLDSVRRGELDRLHVPQQPLDILAQQIVAAVACEDWSEDALYDIVRRAYPYRQLTRTEFDAVVRMLAEGFTTRRGRRSAYLHRDAVNRRLRPRRGARLTAITCGGAIPDSSDYQVVLEPSGTFIGTVNEDFAVESLQGDIFQLGNTSWRILRVEPGSVRVEDAQGQPPSIPFWLGEAPARTAELSASVSRIRKEISERLSDLRRQEDAEAPTFQDSALHWLVNDVGLQAAAAEQIIEYLVASKAALGVMPTQETLVMERFFDETGGMQLVIHSPFGSRLNRAWGLALRKRFCRKFNFELQAAASEDAIVLSLSQSHSFPLDEVFSYLRAESVRDLLVQALLDAPMFGIRWRWNATRALAVVRRRGGRKVPAPLQRMETEDLLAAIFPDQLACAENVIGQREIPDHPLVKQTIADCLQEAMDVDHLEALLRTIEHGDMQLVTRDLREPSPLAQEILNARPYAYLDDAPLEERRTQAVYSRRWLEPETAADLGTLDPAAIRQVCEEAWPDADNPDELHDALLQLGFITQAEGSGDTLPEALDPSHSNTEDKRTMEDAGTWEDCFRELIKQRRATLLRISDQEPALWVAAERLRQLKAIFPTASINPLIEAVGPLNEKSWSFDEALVEILRSRLEGVGPTTVSVIARTLSIDRKAVETALATLEAEGFVLRGHFTSGGTETEWCERRLLARIHRYTLHKLRQEIEPVSAVDFMRFLFAWQKVAPEHRGEGPNSLAAVLEQLEGFQASAVAWEGEILPARLAEYDSNWLDALCISGRLVWARLADSNLDVEKGRAAPIRTTPIALLNRKNLHTWQHFLASLKPEELNLSSGARAVYKGLMDHGASFFADLVQATGLLRSQVEEALKELVSWGLVTADSFAGLRVLLIPFGKYTEGRRKQLLEAFNMENAGRWALVYRGLYSRVPERQDISAPSAANRELASASGGDLSVTQDYEGIDNMARILLRRYGVVFRRLLEREALLPWRDLLRVYRRLEARGEIRGGRFVAGFSGEQFALTEAVGTLRAIRRTESAGNLISVSAADPLNLVGIVTPGNRISSSPSNRILYQDGVPVAILEGGKTRFLIKLDSITEWKFKNALVRRTVPPRLRAYLG